MEFFPIIKGPIEILVAPSEHARVNKGGTFQCDIRTVPGQDIFMPASGKIPHVYKDIFDGGLNSSHYFGIDLDPDNKGDRLCKLIVAHVLHYSSAARKPQGGELIANASGEFVHLGSNDLKILNHLVGL